MATDREILKSAQVGAIGSTPVTAAAATVSAAHTRYYQFLVSDFGTAGRAVTTTCMHMPVKGKVVSVSMTAPLTVTKSDSVYATITVGKQSGASASTIAACATKSTLAAGATGADLAAGVPYKFLASAFTLANCQMAADDVLTVAIAKASTGSALTTVISVVEGTSGSGTEAFSTDYFCITVGVEEN